MALGDYAVDAASKASEYAAQNPADTYEAVEATEAGAPGFGVLAGIVALTSAAALAHRRSGLEEADRALEGEK